jgi:hypothetical protein
MTDRETVEIPSLPLNFGVKMMIRLNKRALADGRKNF